MISTNDDGKVFPDDEMTSRQRLLAAYRGEPVDRLPYWAKVTNGTWLTGQPERVRGWTADELLDYIRADGLFGCGGVVRTTRPHIHAESTTADNVRTTVTRTPDGDLVERWSMDPATRSWHPTEFAVKTRADIAAMRWKYTDVAHEVNPDRVAAAEARVREIGERGVTHTGCGTSPLMDLVEHIIGPIEVHYMLADYGEDVDELIELMHADNVARVEQIARHTPADVIVSVENTSTTLTSPQQFERHCYRHLCDTGRAIEAAGKMHELHMCGHTLVLLETIDTIPAASIEAYTSPTLGNTRLADGRVKAPSKTLIGGTNVMVWLWPIERIQQYILDELAACPDHRRIILTTAGVAAPGCPAETFRAIGEWLRTVPIKV